MAIGEMQLELPRTWAEARPLLRSILRPASYGSLVHAGQPLAWRQPLSTFLHEMVAIDMPTSRVIVTTSHVEDWAVSAVDVFVSARENIATMHPLDRNAPGTERTFLDADQSSYIASAILIPGWLASFARPDGPRPVAFVPTEDTLIICNDDPNEAPKYFEMAEQMYCEAERRGSPEAFTVCAGQVVPFDKAGPHPLRGRAIRARTCAASREFTEQADFLNEVYEEAGIETYAAATKVIDTGHGLATLAVWAEAVIYDLPEADYIVFANHDGHFTVPFPVVLDLVGIQPTAGFFPPRYRVNAWPDAATMEALRFHAVALPVG